VNIVIAGGSGKLGSDCAEILKAHHSVAALSSKELDITNRDMIDAVLGPVAPDIVLNCAALTNLDACEKEKDRAWDINVTGAENLARHAHSRGALLVHLSTDYVFDGAKKPPEPYVEDDPPGPLSHYGLTKLESERVVRKTAGRHIIVRTAWLYGLSGGGFLKTILSRALQDPHKEIRIISDHVGSPTWSYRLGLQIKRLISFNRPGTWHAAGTGYCSWYELARFFLSCMDVPHIIAPCAESDYPAGAARPANSILENLNLKHAGIHLMRDWQRDVEEFVGRHRDRLLSEARARAA